MSFNKNTQFNRGRKPKKRVLIGETRDEEAARLEKEIAAHPVTKCKPGQSNPSSSRPGWSSKPYFGGVVSGNPGFLPFWNTAGKLSELAGVEADSTYTDEKPS